jgi:integrase
MARLGHRQLATTQQYLHTLPDADRRVLAAFTRIRGITAA